jgi:hypothetical protein
LAAAEYQRSIVASVLEVLDGLQAVVPANPARFVWEGSAQRLYVDELARLRDELWTVHALLRQCLSLLGGLRAW